MEDKLTVQVEQIIDYIMRKCLWQFHSRAWDRERQNTEILAKTTQILCGETPDTQNSADRCYWVDAEMMSRGFKREFLWMAELDKDQIKTLMEKVKLRLDFLTIHGSLNRELTDPKY
ncbi:MAG: nitrogenase iron-iron protein delta chain [Candidatus Adiutrix intracellularis]|jgi:nitrogenase delta subunit|nr:MAG: nitrogenase iron-iron protein delta chain [Candidatus Adiutrix intracellularis]MDR2827142.1 Fe-only nitrogenase subunit delta [Candidatus Adiutrix intracellularis]